MNEEANICIFNRYTGKLINAFGKTGKGPGELTNPMEYSLDKDNEYLYVNDYGKESIFRYDLRNWDKTIASSFFEFKLTGPISNRSHILHVMDSLFVAKDLFNRLITATSTKTILEVKTETPDPDVFKMPKDWYAFTNSYSCDAVSPSGEKYVVATLFGGILEIYNIKGMDIQMPLYRYFYKPILQNKGVVYNLTEETIYGFCHLYASDNYLYATVYGKKNPTSMPMAIWKFDWEGNPITEYQCDNTSIESFTVDEEQNKIYVIAYNPEGEQVLGVINL